MPITHQNAVDALKKCVSGFIIGTLLAAGFYHGILVDLGISHEVLQPYGISLGVIFGVACALSERVQCVGLICATLFCSRNGRRTLQAMLFALLITGPGNNMISNTKEAVRTFGCAAELAFNISKDYAYLTVTPFTTAILQMDHQKSADSVAHAVSSVHRQIAPITEAVDIPLDDNFSIPDDEDDEYVEKVMSVHKKYKIDPDVDTDGEIIEKNFMKKVELKCVNAIKNSSLNCKQIFENKYDECVEKVSPLVSWLMCWPMKVDYVCDLPWLVVGKAPCDASTNINRGYGSAFNALKSSDLKTTLGKAKFRYKLPDPDLREEVHDVTSSAKTIEAEVKAKAEGAEVLLGLLSKAVALMFLPTILESVKYVNNYLHRPSYDNVFITKDFEALDLKRASKGHEPVLMPLRRMEKRNLVLTSTPLPNGPETKHYLAPYFRIVLLLFIVLVVLSTDYLYFRTLQVVATHGRFDMTLTGNHTIHIKVTGSGFVAKLVRSLTKNFNNDAFVNHTLSNEHCLPHPNSLQTYYYVKILALFLLMVLFVVADHLPKRARKLICAWYYPKREKQRIVFLYNKLLKARLQWRDIASRRVDTSLEQLRSEEKLNKTNMKVLNFFKSIRVKFWNVRRCILCSTEEVRGEKFVSCVFLGNRSFVDDLP
ncbi:protein sneaky [Neocloeon triangulifer]|uniref:protein sneaky n=1 Tax=Neocloeon triangulifer TaxID=2078957 RepID=UPI00286F2345|nr:protein sneaky [Neocloeon triangulifer]